jgi:hypothetical protein
MVEKHAGPLRGRIVSDESNLFSGEMKKAKNMN